MSQRGGDVGDSCCDGDDDFDDSCCDGDDDSLPSSPSCEEGEEDASVGEDDDVVGVDDVDHCLAVALVGRKTR